MLSDFVPEGRSSDEKTLVNILTYQLGSVANGLHYATIRTGNEKTGHQLMAKMGLSDLVTTCRQLAETEGWDWYEVLEMGEVRFIERMTDAKNRIEEK